MVAMVVGLGLDIGRKRIGVAISDPTGLLATGLPTLTWPTAPQALAQIVQVRHPQVLVVGLPAYPDGRPSAQTRYTQKQGGYLGRCLHLPVVYVDEVLTSWSAAQTLDRRRYRSEADYRAAVDQQAAILIVQQWLDSHSFHSGDNYGSKFPTKF
ncbi:Holliday junction resolvase-like protein [Gloeomargarita lithophora Alchichica-D10]|uniref:Putative pre-16S rRNA nuclease n=1 Tax=Gloeomargarita lithophora Alchichica-D10 TaxID=1188229 RepID=A0A1J0ACU5_9CYAN|nr:Holliday junction resolvase RuvX [Gloeomargarita lithophora]APB33757.1 Holliday junction resolvase-like protein [Gloeomargarita lithophora Alchichica-D10]